MLAIANPSVTECVNRQIMEHPLHVLHYVNLWVLGTGDESMARDGAAAAMLKTPWSEAWANQDGLCHLLKHSLAFVTVAVPNLAAPILALGSCRLPYFSLQQSVQLL